MNTSLLREMAERAGIESGYQDTWGNQHQASDATLRALLHAMGWATDSPDAMRTALAQMDAQQGNTSTPDAGGVPAWQPEALAGAGRRWGISVQLYALRTASTWGIGDFSALAELVQGAAALGAAAIGINPLHALFPQWPEHVSPYSPSSRRFINPLYLDIEAMEDFAAWDATQTWLGSDDFACRLNVVREGDQIAYAAVAALKLPVLASLYAFFRRHCLSAPEHPRTRDFRRFQRREGSALRRFATFHALAEARPEANWHDWPAAFADPDSSAVAAFAVERAETIEFHEYLQWQVAVQLENVHATAQACGMSIGLFADLAVGADPNGAECWSGQACLARGVSIGAPPDALNLHGQNWGLPAPDPGAMARADWAPFIELWRSNMRGIGALRIDHILGLMRLYWIPADTAAIDGAYVRYPWRELLPLLVTQSRDSQCLVVGEDLGTVPEGLREAMHAAGILSCRLLVFEQDDGHFRASHDYPADALVASGTHDLPSLPMWWDGGDIALRDRLGLWPEESQRQAELAQREQARRALIDVLQAEGLHDGNVPDAAPIEAIHAFLARTPCKLLMLRLEDVLGLHVQVNLPGTVDEHPNWRQRLPCTVDAALAHPRLQSIAAMLEDNGRSDP